MKKTISSLMIATVLASSLALMPSQTVKAAAASLTVDSPANAAVAPSTATEVVVHWQIGKQIGTSPIMHSGSRIFIKAKSATSSQLIGGTLAACTTGTTTIGTSVAYSNAYGAGTHTITLGGDTSADDIATACVKLPALGDGVYYLSVYTEEAFDSLATAVYVGTANQVTVTADVEPAIGFTLSANSCDLGVLTTANTSACSYNATTTTNTALTGGNPIKIQVRSNDGDNKLVGTLDSNNKINNVIGGNCSAITSASGGSYGFRVSAFSGDWVDGSYDCTAGNASSIPTSATNILLSDTDWSGLGTFTVEHIAEAGPNTKVDHYSHAVIYTVTVDF